MRFLKAIRECSSYFRKQSPEAISEGTISWQNCFWLSAGNCQKCAKIKFDSAGQAFLHKKTRLKMWKNACLTPYNDILLYFWFLLETNIILREINRNTIKLKWLHKGMASWLLIILNWFEMNIWHFRSFSTLPILNVSTFFRQRALYSLLLFPLSFRITYAYIDDHHPS